MTRCAAIFLLASPSFAWAQNDDKGVLPLTYTCRHGDISVLDTCERCAIVVGASNYGGDWRVLTWTDADLAQMEEVLPRYGQVDGLYCMFDPSADHLMTALERVEARSGHPPASLLMYFSGHGCSKARVNYLALPADRSRCREGVQPNALVGLGEVIDRLERSGSPQRVLLVDACRNQPIKGDGEVQSFSPVEPRLLGSGTRVMLASADGSPAYFAEDLRRSYFTYYLGLALTGYADGALGGAVDGLITFDEAFAYTRSRVFEATQSQRPPQQPTVPTADGREGGVRYDPGDRRDMILSATCRIGVAPGCGCPTHTAGSLGAVAVLYLSTDTDTRWRAASALGHELLLTAGRHQVQVRPGPWVVDLLANDEVTSSPAWGAVQSTYLCPGASYEARCSKEMRTCRVDRR